MVIFELHATLLILCLQDKFYYIVTITEAIIPFWACWGLNKMAHVLQTKLSYAFFSKKTFVFWFKFHQSLFVRLQLDKKQAALVHLVSCNQCNISPILWCNIIPIRSAKGTRFFNALSCSVRKNLRAGQEFLVHPKGPMIMLLHIYRPGWFHITWDGVSRFSACGVTVSTAWTDGRRTHSRIFKWFHQNKT